MRSTWLVLALLLIPLPAAPAEQEGVLADAPACLQRNVPEPDTVRAVMITARDRTGAESVTVAKFYGRRSPDGMRQLLVRFLEPEDVRGSSLLMLEREGEAEMYFRSPDLAEPKRIVGVKKSLTLFGSDVTFEDFEHLQAFARTGHSKQLTDSTLQERPVYVLETRPPEDANSAYDRIVTFVDKKTCLALRMEFYEEGSRLRKELIVNPHQILKRGSLWVAHMALMRDLRDFTTTQILVDSTEQDVPLPEEMFSIQQIGGDSP